jgi:hypothetical protein
MNTTNLDNRVCFRLHTIWTKKQPGDCPAVKKGRETEPKFI